MFAEFEKITHAMVAAGEPLTWEGMARLAADVEASSLVNAGQYPGYTLGEEGE